MLDSTFKCNFLNIPIKNVFIISNVGFATFDLLRCCLNIVGPPI